MLRHRYHDRGVRRFPAGLSEFNRRQQDVHVEAFLAFAKAQGRRRLQELTDSDIADFLNEIRRDHGEQRAYRYALDLVRFVRTFRLGIRVPSLRSKMRSKKLARIEVALGTLEELDDALRARIMAAIGRTI
jgi:hypothetical protein